MRFAYAKSIGLRRLAYGGGSSASEQLLTLATAAGAEAVYDFDNDDTWTLRDDGADLWYSAVADGLGNRPDLVQATAANQPKQRTLSTGARVGQAPTADKFMLADFVTDIVQPNTILVVFHSADLTIAAAFFDSDAATGGRQQFLLEADLDYRMFAGTLLRAPETDKLWHIAQANFNGASSELFIETTTELSGDAGLQDLGGVGAFGTGLAAANIIGDIATIIVFPGLKTNAELSDIRDQINSRLPIGVDE